MVEALKQAGLWLVEHLDEIVSVVLMIIGALEVVVKWTETAKDDKAVAKAKTWVNKLNKFAIEIISYITKFKGTK